MSASKVARRLAGRSAAPLDVVGFGEVGRDEVWLLGGPLLRGGKQRAADRLEMGGGQVATLLVACARLGRRVAFGGAVGSDALGRALLEELATCAVDVSRAHTADAVSRTALVLVEPDGERTVIERGSRRATPPVESPPIDSALLDEARILHVDTADLPASLDAARRARERGLVVSVDIDQVAPGVGELLALADVCITSEGLPEALTGEPELPRALAELRARTGAELVGCTLGASGAALLGDGELVRAAGFSVEVLDTTGCGDVFRAALLCALLEDLDLTAAVRFANAAAALNCRAIGRRGCPTRAELDEFLRGSR